MSLEKMTYDAATGTVIYRSKMHAGLKRNVQGEIFMTASRSAVALLALLQFLPVADARAQTYRSEDHAFGVVRLVEGLDHPWGLAFLPDGAILVTERPGRLRVVRGGKLEPAPIGGLPHVVARGQGGLLDVALHPRYADNRLVYLSYAGQGEGGISTDVARGRYTGARLLRRPVCR